MCAHLSSLCQLRVGVFRETRAPQTLLLLRDGEGPSVLLLLAVESRASDPEEPFPEPGSHFLTRRPVDIPLSGRLALGRCRHRLQGPHYRHRDQQVMKLIAHHGQRPYPCTMEHLSNGPLGGGSHPGASEMGSRCWLSQAGLLLWVS